MRMLACVLWMGCWAGSVAAANLTIPTTHPRLWFGDAARLQQAQGRFATTPFSPGGADVQFERALRGVAGASADEVSDETSFPPASSTGA